MPETVLIIDNYDSFVYNIAQIVGGLGYIPIVIRNDEITLSGVDRINPDKIIISPGPGTPERREDVGIAIDVIKTFGKHIPILGICFGHQMIGYAFGARIRKAKIVMHGKISRIRVINEVEIFRGVPKVFTATRYNSLVVDDVKPPLEVDAISEEDGEIMAIHHTKYPIYGVQFHPESIGTEIGVKIIKNFLELT